MLGIEDIIKNITVHNGQSRGVTPAEVRAVWHGLWNCVERLLAQGKSVTIPNFCNISVINNGKTPSLSFTLLQHFTSTHNVVSPLDVKGPGTGVATAVMMHAAFIEQELGGSVTRHGIQNTLKDTVRHIGLVAGTGKALRLDCNPVMTMNFLNCRASVSFNGRLARVLPSPARGGVQQQQRSQSNQGGDQTTTNSARRASQQEEQDVEESQPRSVQQQQQLVPRPPPSQQQSNNNNNASSSRASTPRSNVGEQQQQEKQDPRALLNTLISSGRSGNNQAEAMSAARGTFSQASSAARAHNRDQRMSLARQCVENMPVSEYKKHQLKKNIYRHLRGEVYRNIWEQNQMDVSARRQAEAQADKELMDHLEAVAAHEKAMLEQRERDRRRTAMETRVLNQKLAPLQKAQQLPRVQDPGEIFYQRQNPLVLQKDTQTLLRQIQDRKRKEENEREEDRKIAEQAHQEYLKVRQEIIDEKKRRQQAQVVLRAETERIINDKNRRLQTELDHDRHMARNGGLFFEEGGNVFAERSRAIMRENVELMRQRAQANQRERNETLTNQGAEFRNQLVEDAAQAVAQRKHDHEVKESMREAWEKQIAEKNAKLRAEKRARDTWRDRWRIQNSSSDDDDH